MILINLKSDIKLTKKNKLSNQKYNKQILTIAIPASLGFFFHTMFNVIDTYYAGLLNTSALAGLSASFPIFFLIIAVSSGLGTGVTSLMSNYLGSNQEADARKLLWQAIFLGFFASIIITLIGLFVSPLLLRLQGTTADYYPYALVYLQVIFIGAFSFIYFNIFNSALVALGDSKKFRNALLVGLILNCILNPLLMFTCKLGIAGVALATILIEALQAVYLLLILRKRKFFIFSEYPNLWPNPLLIKVLIKHSGLAALNMLTIGVGIYVILSFIARAGGNAVAAYGLGIRIEQIVLLPAIGLSMATQSLAGRYNGAGDLFSAKIIYQQSLKFAAIVSTVGCFLIFVFKKILIAIFTSDLQVTEIASQYLSYAAFLLFCYSVIIISNSFFFAVKRPKWPMLLGFIRLIVNPLIFFPILYGHFAVKGVWIGLTSNNTLMAAVIFIAVQVICFPKSQNDN